MFTRYFLAQDGTKVAPQSGEEDHADIGRRVLTSVGITPSDYDDIYNQMFALGFVRVVEYPARICAENPVKKLSAGQLGFLENIQFESKKELLFNDSLFEETRCGRSLNHEALIALNELKGPSCGDQLPVG